MPSLVSFSDPGLSVVTHLVVLWGIAGAGGARRQPSAAVCVLATGGRSGHLPHLLHYNTSVPDSGCLGMTTDAIADPALPPAGDHPARRTGCGSRVRGALDPWRSGLEMETYPSNDVMHYVSDLRDARHNYSQLHVGS